LSRDSTLTNKIDTLPELVTRLRQCHSRMRACEASVRAFVRDSNVCCLFGRDKLTPLPKDIDTLYSRAKLAFDTLQHLRRVNRLVASGTLQPFESVEQLTVSLHESAQRSFAVKRQCVDFLNDSFQSQLIDASALPVTPQQIENVFVTNECENIEDDEALFARIRQLQHKKYHFTSLTQLNSALQKPVEEQPVSSPVASMDDAPAPASINQEVA